MGEIQLHSIIIIIIIIIIIKNSAVLHYANSKVQSSWENNDSLSKR